MNVFDPFPIMSQFNCVLVIVAQSKQYYALETLLSWMGHAGLRNVLRFWNQMTHTADFNHGISDSFELIYVGDNYFGKNAEGKSVWTNQACLYHPAFPKLTLLLFVAPHSRRRSVIVALMLVRCFSIIH